MDAFERASEGKRVFDFSAASFSGRKTKNRSQPFAPGEKAVAHRPVKRRRFRTRFRQIAIERAVDLFLPGSEISFQIHFTSADRIDAICSIPSEAEKAARDFPPIRLPL